MFILSQDWQVFELKLLGSTKAFNFLEFWLHLIQYLPCILQREYFHVIIYCMWRWVRHIIHSHFYLQIYFQMFPILLCSRQDAHGSVPKNTWAVRLECHFCWLMSLFHQTQGVPVGLWINFKNRVGGFFLLCLLLTSHQDRHLKIPKTTHVDVPRRKTAFQMHQIQQNTAQSHFINPYTQYKDKIWLQGYKKLLPTLAPPLALSALDIYSKHWIQLLTFEMFIQLQGAK